MTSIALRAARQPWRILRPCGNVVRHVLWVFQQAQSVLFVSVHARLVVRAIIPRGQE